MHFDAHDETAAAQMAIRKAPGTGQTAAAASIANIHRGKHAPAVQTKNVCNVMVSVI